VQQPSDKTKYSGLLAHPVDHVKAPSFMNPEFEKMGLNWFITPMHVRPDNLEDAIRGLQKIKNFLGVNLTIPHKEKMTKLCDKLGPNAQRTGTVNAVRFADDLLIGEMFDGVGLIKGQKKRGIEVTNRNSLILGAGGAARAVAFSYIDEGIKYL
jgi:shikimate dehydrogenase